MRSITPSTTPVINTRIHHAMRRDLDALVKAHSMGWVLESLSDLCAVYSRAARDVGLPEAHAQWVALGADLAKLVDVHCPETR